MKLPRFTLRDLFWLVLVAAMGLGWWLEHSRAQSLMYAASEAEEKRLTTERLLDESLAARDRYALHWQSVLASLDSDTRAKVVAASHELVP